MRGTKLAPLLYWLLVVCGLAGITLLRLDSAPDDVFALWVGTALGVALGQGFAALRIRAWVPLVLAMFGFWFIVPILVLVLDGIFGVTAQTFVLAFLPASICGYLSLSERGALLSFWYPAVLWMIVILDGPVPGAFDERFALPFVIGLGALFVAYLRARETRRVAIWKGHANERLATELPRIVLRSSPLRAASQHAWSAMVGAAALVLTAWIAPHLWETTKDPSRIARSAAAATGGSSYAASKPCCPSDGAGRRERVKEYFSLQHGHDTHEDDGEYASCRVCAPTPVPVGELSSGGSSWSYGGYPHGAATGGTSWSATDDQGSSYAQGSPGGVVAQPPMLAAPATPAPFVPSPTTTPKPTVLDDDAKPTVAKTPVPKPATAAASTPSTTTATATPAVAVEPIAPPPTTTAHAPLAMPSPWRSSIALCALAFAFVLFTRASRRALTLRHLARPFWNESIDQRISNHWQRMLVALRDAGVEPSRDEPPAAFARRIGIAGMETCATILDRVRHGVRLEAEDLEAMASASESVFREARARAGFAGRATAWMRPVL